MWTPRQKDVLPLQKYAMARLILFFFPFYLLFSNEVLTGVDVFFQDGHIQMLEGKKVGIITNHTGVNRNLKPTFHLLLEHATNYQVTSLYSPEHGVNGSAYASEKVLDSKTKGGIQIFSLHGKTRRPNDKMLNNVDLLIYDIQCIGSRSYTYLTTLCYVMEEAAKRKIPVIIFDRPNPMGGNIVDGPMLDQEKRSFIGYINVPYCHGMTIGELATLFNEEYKIGCDLKVIPLKGWKRSMSYSETGLSWVPPSPHIPEPDTPFFYPSTGILGELKVANIGVGYTLPFKVVGAPWIEAEEFAEKLNAQKLEGVTFLPFHFRPFYGLYKGEECQGIKIQITDKEKYKPLNVQYLLIGMLKSLYPKEFHSRVVEGSTSMKLFSQANGTDEIYQILKQEKYAVWKLLNFGKEERSQFLEKRNKYLIYRN